MNIDLDIHCSRGPVSSMPGSSHPFPAGSKCDVHADRLAVRRAQGETDSFGCEYVLQCQECVDAHKAYLEEERNTERRCDYCHNMAKDLRPMRDYDEGMAGPLYQVCPACRTREAERAAQELEDLSLDDQYPDDDGFDEDDNDDDEPEAEVPFEERQYRVRYQGTSLHILRRDGRGPLTFLGRRAAERWYDRHSGKIRNQRVVLQPFSV